MHQLSPFTCRRLSQLPRLTSVWECDRRPLAAAGYALSDSAETSQGDCIIWVDSLQGVVRGLSVVPRETGHEAIVRTLLQAIETPQGGVDPARPRKVVVCDREIQFFLRGALQDLDIPVEHVPSLPAIDEVFEKLRAPDIPLAKLPPVFEQTLLEKAELIWQDAPWQHLSEQEILAIELNCWEIDTLYLSILGLAGMEYGLLFYRELESLQQFRHKLLHGDDFSEGMQQAFLEQNCLFVNFNPVEDVIPMPMLAGSMQPNSSAPVEYEFGSLHPLEGLRSQLAEEEAASLIVVLEALHRFFNKHDLGVENFALQPLSNRFRIPNPARGSSENQRQAPPEAKMAKKNKGPKGASARAADGLSGAQKTGDRAKATLSAEKIAVKVSTLPEVSAAFLEETLGTAAAPDLAPLPRIVNDSVPEGALIMLGSYKDKDLNPLRESRRIHYQRFLSSPETLPGSRAKWPILTIQTTRPKAKRLVEQFQQEGGLQAICFNPGSDPISGQVFQIGLMQTGTGQLHLFNEYEISNPGDNRAMEKWVENSAHGCCGCIIAAGATGARRGRPTAREVVAFFEMQAKFPEELGLSPLVMSYAVDLEP